MPVNIIYLDDGLGAMLRGTGVVTGQDIISANEEMFSTPEKTQKYLYGLSDWTGTTDYNVTISDLEYATYQNLNTSDYFPEEYVIGIVAKEDLPFGLARMFGTSLEAHGLKWDVKVFRIMTEVELWIKESVKKKYGLDLKVTESFPISMGWNS